MRINADPASITATTSACQMTTTSLRERDRDRQNRDHFVLRSAASEAVGLIDSASSPKP